MQTHQYLTEQIDLKNLPGHIHRLSRLLSNLSELRWQADGYSDIHSAHIQLLRHLDVEGTRSTVLAQRAQVTKQTMSRLVQELTRSGYVKTVPDPADSRAQQVKLTERGQAFLHYLVTALTDLERTLAQVLGEENLISFNQTLQALLTFADTRWQQLS